MNMRKTNKNVDANEFNRLLENCKKYNINHELKIYSTSVQLETNSHIYRCSLTGREEDIVNVYHGCHDLGCRGTKQAETV